MNKHFLENINIKNFKCFDNFNTKGFKRVNLISGKNNVGKTALLEALFVNAHSTDIKTMLWSLRTIKYMRENLNILANDSNYKPIKFIESSNDIYTKSNINSSLFKIKEEDGVKEYYFNINNKEQKINVNNFSYEMSINKKVFFIDNFGSFDIEIINHYSAIQKKDKEPYLNNILNSFDSQIESFKIIDEKPQCKVGGKYIPVTELGDGTKHLIDIITSLYRTENGYLFIDEIDNGIHYTMLDNLWEVILKVSKELNVQIFSTTHSKECIESYVRVAEKLEDEDITFIELFKHENKIKSMTLDKEMLKIQLNQNHEVR